MQVKEILFQAADATGIQGAIRRSRWRQERLCILCYHSISSTDEHEAFPELYMPADTLRRRMQYLRDNDYNVLPFGQAVQALYAGQLPPQAVAVTFDDGTRDFADLAVPILEEFEIPATLYVTTFYSEHRTPIFNTAFRYLLWHARHSGIDLASLFAIPAATPLGTADDAQRLIARKAVFAWADDQDLSADARLALLRKFASAIDFNFNAFLAEGQFCIMTPEQIAALPSPLIDVQLHTHRHRAPRDEALFRREIVDNRASIVRAGRNEPLLHFCYPSGDYSHRFLPWLEQLGVTSGTTCEPGLASKHSHPMLLPRFIDTMLTPEPTFTAVLDGTADLLRRCAQTTLSPFRTNNSKSLQPLAR